MTAASETSPREGVWLFDLVERGFLLTLGVWAFLRLAPAVPHEPHVALILISEGLAVAFVMLRKPAKRLDFRPYAATVALVGTSAPLFVIASGEAWIDPTAGIALMAAGLLLNISAKLALNRSFGLAAANRGVKRAGPYKLLRHPMYAGYLLTQVAFLLLNPSLWNLAVYAVAWSMQLLRIQAEERLLLEDPAYRDYAAQVRYRVIPGVY